MACCNISNYIEKECIPLKEFHFHKSINQKYVISVREQEENEDVLYHNHKKYNIITYTSSNR